jgi:hypothetical protein
MSNPLITDGPGKFNREPKTEPKELELKPKEPKPKNSVPDIEEPK